MTVSPENVNVLSIGPISYISTAQFHTVLSLPKKERYPRVVVSCVGLSCAVRQPAVNNSAPIIMIIFFIALPFPYFVSFICFVSIICPSTTSE